MASSGVACRLALQRVLHRFVQRVLPTRGVPVWTAHQPERLRPSEAVGFGSNFVRRKHPFHDGVQLDGVQAHMVAETPVAESNQRAGKQQEHGSDQQLRVLLACTHQPYVWFQCLGQFAQQFFVSFSQEALDEKASWQEALGENYLAPPSSQ